MLQVEYKRVTVQETDSIRVLLTGEGFKPRDSPSRIRVPKVSLPENFIEYTKRVLQRKNQHVINNVIVSYL